MRHIADPVARLEYDYYNDGDVRSVMGNGLTRTFRYDDQRRLTDAFYEAGTSVQLTETYNYDEAGNRLLKRRNGKQYVSVFDLKQGSNGQTPANNLLRHVIDPPLDGGCVPALPPGDDEDGDDDDDDGEECDDRHRNQRGRGHQKHCGEGGHRESGEDDDGRGHRHHEGCGHGKHGEADAGVTIDAGTPLPVCPPTRTKADVRALKKEWRKLLKEADALVSRLPFLTNAQAQEKLAVLLETRQASSSGI